MLSKFDRLRRHLDESDMFLSSNQDAVSESHDLRQPGLGDFPHPTGSEHLALAEELRPDRTQIKER